MHERHGVPLAPLTTLGLGGRARRLVTVTDEAELVDVVRCADEAGEPVLVLGGGSNVVLPDEGFEGTVVRVATAGLTATRDGDRVLLDVAAGQEWDGLVAGCVADGLVGVEALSGIPGLVGASPVQNVGAYGQEVAQTLTRVRAYDRARRAVVQLDSTACRFSYRHSVFKADPGRYVVLGVQFALTPGQESAPVRYAELARRLGVDVAGRAPLAQVRGAVLGLRAAKGMVLDPTDPDTRSAGSFFTNPVLSRAELARLRDRAGPDLPTFDEPDGRVKTSAAWLIERAGFTRGAFAGPVGLSGKHVLAIVHRGGGSTADLLRVARAVRDGVRERFGVELVPEPVLVGLEL